MRRGADQSKLEHMRPGRQQRQCHNFELHVQYWLLRVWLSEILHTYVTRSVLLRLLHTHIRPCLAFSCCFRKGLMVNGYNPAHFISVRHPGPCPDLVYALVVELKSPIPG
jgi:hypothetical protein